MFFRSCFDTNLSLAQNIVKEVLSTLTNFVAFFESEESHKDEIEEEIEKLRNTAIQNEKKLVDEERYLDKCKQVLSKSLSNFKTLNRNCFRMMKRKRSWVQNCMNCCSNKRIITIL